MCPSVVLECGEDDSRAFLVCYPDNCLQKTDGTLLNHYYRDSLLTSFSGNSALEPGTVQDRNFEGSVYRKTRRLVQCCSFLMIL